MINKIVHYEIHNGYSEFINDAIKEFKSAIKENEPDTLYEAYSYNTSKYVHIMTFKDEIAEELHKNAKYTILFVEKLYPKCIEQPKFYEATQL